MKRIAPAGDLRAISLWQPWASAMASGAKRNETRSWPTTYRGDLVICSAKRKADANHFGGGIEGHRFAMGQPYGYALCIVELYDVVPTSEFHGLYARELTADERELGDYTPGRFAWMTRNCRTLQVPIPVVGCQGLWRLPAEIVTQIEGVLKSEPNDAGSATVTAPGVSRGDLWDTATQPN